MPIKNYTTKIPVHKTVGQIQAILARAGARSVMVDYDRLAHPVAVSFVVDVNGRFVNFRLPTHVDGVHKALLRDPEVARRLSTEEQAHRVAWRVVRDWVDAQLAFIEAEQATLAEVFLPHAVGSGGETLYQLIERGGFLLGSGES